MDHLRIWIFEIENEYFGHSDLSIIIAFEFIIFILFNDNDDGDDDDVEDGEGLAASRYFFGVVLNRD